MARLVLRGQPLALVASDQRMPRDDRHRAARAGARRRAGRQAPAAHGLRRHRRRDLGDQRHRARPLPPQAVGPARGPALPGRRRPALRLAQRPPRADERRPRRGAPVVRGAATSSRRSSPTTTSRTSGSTSSATRRAPGCATSPAREPEDLPLVLVPDGETAARPDTRGGRDGPRPAHPRRARPLRPLHRRWRPGRSRRRGLRRVRGAQHRRRRARRPGRAGRSERGDRELPRLPAWAVRRRPRPAGHRPGPSLRCRDGAGPGRRRPRGPGPGARRPPRRRRRHRGPQRRRSRPASPTDGSTPPGLDALAGRGVHYGVERRPGGGRARGTRSTSSARPTPPARRRSTSPATPSRVTLVVRGEALEASMSQYLVDADPRRRAHPRPVPHRGRRRRPATATSSG